MQFFKQIQIFIDVVGNKDLVHRASTDDVRAACAALLVYCARADGQQSAEETLKIQKFLSDEFSLSAEQSRTVLSIAEKREEEAVDLYQFTRVLHTQWDRQQRLEFVRLMWELVYEDRHIDYAERSAVSLIAELMDVEVRDVVGLRRRVTE